MTAPGGFDDVEELGYDELRQRLRSLQQVIARAPVPIAIATDPECRFISANAALAELLGLPLDANFSMTPGDQTRPLYRIQRDGVDLPPQELPMQYAIAHRTSVRNEIEIVRADGTVVHVQNDVEPLFDTRDAIYGCISVCVDITDRKLAERTLREADRRKDEFLATLSHELRNPLAPLRTALEVLRITRDAEVAERARLTMERQLAQLVRITDDLLDVSRIAQNKVELLRDRLDLRTILHSAIEATRPLIDIRGHVLGVTLPDHALWIDADAARLAQVFSNLLNNAAKFTNPGGQIHVTAIATGGSAVVTVADTGIGIPPGLTDRVFDMFTQLQAFRDRTHSGLGIGLTLAKRLVEMHGGTIAAQSEGENRGSTFRVSLPLAQASDNIKASPGDPESSSPAGCRILVAEDNADAAEMMQMMLRLKGHIVVTAADGVEAVALADSFRPRIAFIDIGMPLMDGYEAARQIRRRLGSHIVLVALTGWGQDDDKERALEAGFDHHITKPPEPDLLDQLIASCLDEPAGDAR